MNTFKHLPHVSLVLVLALTGLTGCASTTQQATAPAADTAVKVTQTPIADGTYDVQSVNFEDVTGAYQMFLLNPPAGSRPVVERTEVKMARLTDEQVKQGKKSYLEVKGNQPTLFLTPDFQIAYTHSVTQSQPNPQTGRTETVIVRQESSFWTPFLASMAGAAIGNALFAPSYYAPPMYSQGRMYGYGGYGATPSLANQSYQQKYGSLPPANRLSSSGSVLKRGSSSSSMRSSGSGVGSSRLNTGSSSRSSKGFSFGSSRRRR
jgi:hypothetical protein